MNLIHFPRPFDTSRISLYQFIVRNLGYQEQLLLVYANTLPDEEVEIPTYHKKENLQPEIFAEELCDKIYQGLTYQENMGELLTAYGEITQNDPELYIEALINEINSREDVEYELLVKYALWMVEDSPDRRAVKVAIAILGMHVAEEESEKELHEKIKLIIRRFALHPEFKEYTSVALIRLSKNPLVELYERAKSARDYGREDLISRICLINLDNMPFENKEEQQAFDKELRHWLITEAWCERNLEPSPETILECAERGKLYALIKQQTTEDYDYQILLKAGQMLGMLSDTLLIYDYKYGAVAIGAYLDIVTKIMPMDVEIFAAILDIKKFLESFKWEIDQDPIWDEYNEENTGFMLRKIDEYMADERWPEYAKDYAETLSGAVMEYFKFFAAIRVCKELNIDTWDYLYARQSLYEEYRQNGVLDAYKEYAKTYYKMVGNWHYLSTDEPARADKLIELVEKYFPLEEMKTATKEQYREYRDYFFDLAKMISHFDKFPSKKIHDLICISISSHNSTAINSGLDALFAWCNIDSGIKLLKESTILAQLDELKIELEQTDQSDMEASSANLKLVEIERLNMLINRIREKVFGERIDEKDGRLGGYGEENE